MTNQSTGSPFQESTDELLPIGTVAREVDLTPRAIRYYEEIGLLRPAVRVKGADRLFDSSDVQRLREIKRLREVIGFSCAEIAEILDTDAIRAQLRDQFHGTTDPTTRTQVLHDALALAERRLTIVGRKLSQVQAVYYEEEERLTRIRGLLAEEESRAHPPTHPT
ncbi:MAG TPA: MerR family transcriptional regulator [Chloroflexota bacterium]|nr:MerR family transcriptional regulator [Chloroflexota bacterium]